MSSTLFGCIAATSVRDSQVRSVARGFIMLKPTKIFGELRDI